MEGGGYVLRSTGQIFDAKPGSDRAHVRDRPRVRPLQLSGRSRDVHDHDLFEVETSAAGPQGALPLTDSFLQERPSGDVFGLSQNAGMGWEASKVGRDQFLILSTLGGVRADDGTPIALGYHTGHWEVGLLVREAAEQLDRLGGLPFAGARLRPVRRPQPGHDGDVRLAAVPERRRDSSCAGSFAACRTAAA